MAEEIEGCCGGHHHDEGHECCGGHGGCCHGHGDQIAMFVVGPIETNCYAYVSQDECMVVDAGNSGAAIAEHLPEGIRLKYIVATRVMPNLRSTRGSRVSRGAPTTTTLPNPT